MRRFVQLKQERIIQSSLRFLLTFIFAVVLVITPNANSEAASGTFTRRNSPPSTSSSYYYGSNGYQGYSMPNCTAYAYGRIYEINGNRPNVSQNNACKWFSYNKDNGAYPYSTDPYAPQLGAVVCYGSGNGHVQVVEEVGNDSGGAYICVSESNYSGRDNPTKSFNYIKIYLNELDASRSSGAVNNIIRLEDNDGYAEERYNMFYQGFQGYIYACYAQTMNYVYPLVDGGTYKIKSVLSGKVLEVPSGVSTKVNLQVWDYTGGAWQTWVCKKNGDVYNFVNPHTGQAIDIRNNSRNSGAELIQYPYNTSASEQKYKLVDAGNGRYGIISTHSWKAIDIYGSSKDNGAQVKLYDYHGGANQLWTFVPLDQSGPSITNVKVTNITTEGYRVSCTVTDPSGISKVQFPTWTDANGQDDLIWHDGTANGSTYYYDVKISSHKSESGSYTTHIYAYDQYGNKSTYGVIATVPANVILDLNGVLDRVPENSEKCHGDISDWGTADVYLDGKKVADDVTDFYQTVAEGTKYEIKDIKTKSGYKYTKYLFNVPLSGKVGKSRVDVTLFFETVKNNPTYTIKFYDGNTLIYKENYKSNTLIKKPQNPTKSGATFGGWYLDNACKKTVGWTNLKATGNMSFYAKWYYDKKITYGGNNYLIKFGSNGAPTDIIFTGQGKFKKELVIDTIKYNGKTCQVTSIAPMSMWFTNIASLTIGSGVKNIGYDAFYGCSYLKTIKIKTNKLTSKTVGKYAFSSIHAKAVIKVPSSKLASYKKILKSAGVDGRKQKITK